MESIKKRLTGIGGWLAGQWKRLAAGIGSMLHSREIRIRVGYYMGLALLLGLLGLGSHAWRMRGQSQGEVSPPPRAAMAVGIPTLTPIPTATPEPVLWTWPLEGEILAEYAPDTTVWSETLGQWQSHPGIDIAAAAGEAVAACAAGTVREAWEDPLWGDVIEIEHRQGYVSTYANLSTLNMVAPGDEVAAGQIIGAVGNTAACESEMPWHLHFALMRDGAPVDCQKLLR